MRLASDNAVLIASKELPPMRFSRAIATSSLIVALLAAIISAPASAAPSINTLKPTTTSHFMPSAGIKPAYNFGRNFWAAFLCW
ncbi:hypothetical protein [Actinomyces trachealis]|uniref:hypothetical protein n=1 Tax=Actinomyces trachealis TaxID=2763540 RepID=UPI0018C7284A|nr:hypothetical protein [Actinomyces trachealis]